MIKKILKFQKLLSFSRYIPNLFKRNARLLVTSQVTAVDFVVFSLSFQSYFHVTGFANADRLSRAHNDGVLYNLEICENARYN